MARKKKIYDDDDGRTIADMSQVSGQNLWLPRSSRSDKRDEPDSTADTSGEAPYSRKERNMFILGALKAALLIALAFIGGLALVIIILLYVWNN
ncbi:MAG: hypothetical protein ACI3VB_02865 [Oscillospiraceae bacterium]